MTVKRSCKKESLRVEDPRHGKSWLRQVIDLPRIGMAEPGVRGIRYTEVSLNRLAAHRHGAEPCFSARTILRREAVS
jgi:hypothetical protein